jgi:hypothetical protein
MREQATHTRVCAQADDVIATTPAHEAEPRAAGLRRL